MVHLPVRSAYAPLPAAARGHANLHALATAGARRPAHGRALSSCAASRNSVPSSPKRPTNWTPSGRPLDDHASGTDIAGWPVGVNSAVDPGAAKTGLGEPAGAGGVL